MSLIKWSPDNDPFKEMEKMMKEFSPSLRSVGGSRRFAPAIDVYDEDGNIIIESPLAGINPDNVDISIENGVLTLKGESKKEHEVDEEDYYRKEVRGGSFFRQISLPTQVDEGSITAEYKDGVLKVTCPKSEQSGGRSIEVKKK